MNPDNHHRQWHRHPILAAIVGAIVGACAKQGLEHGPSVAQALAWMLHLLTK